MHPELRGTFRLLNRLAQDGTRKVVTFTDPEFDEDLQARLISWLD